MDSSTRLVPTSAVPVRAHVMQQQYSSSQPDLIQPNTPADLPPPEPQSWHHRWFAAMNLHPVHNVKKRVSLATTRKKVAKDIGEEFLDLKAQLATVLKTMQSYTKGADDSNAAWGILLQTQRDFAAMMTSSYARDDTVRATAQQFASNLTALQSTFSLGAGADAPHRALHSTVVKYIHELTDAAKHYIVVERGYAEYLRYSAKSDRIGNRKNHNEDKLQRNLEKRDRARVEYHAKLDAAVATMRAVLRKHPAVFQIALASYWLRNAHTLALFSDHTGQMHSECAAIAEALIRVDLTQPHTYENLLPANADPLPIPPPPSVPHSMQPSGYPALPAPAPAPAAIMPSPHTSATHVYAPVSATPVVPAPAPAAPASAAPTVSFSSPVATIPPHPSYSSPPPAAVSFPPPPATVSFPPPPVAVPAPPPSSVPFPARVAPARALNSIIRPQPINLSAPPAPPPPPPPPGGRPMRLNASSVPPPPPPPPPAVRPPPIVHGSTANKPKPVAA